MRLSLSPFVRVTSTPIRYDGCLLAGGACFGVGTKERLTGNGAGEFFNGFLSVDPKWVAERGVAEWLEAKLDPLVVERMGARAFALGVIAPRLLARFNPGV
jgi:hypothetical protein